VNLQAYAAHRKAQGLRGQSHVAVLKAIETGRLMEPAVRKVGNRWHIDPALADAQWAGNTDTSHAPDPPEPIEAEPPEPPTAPATPRRATRARQPHIGGNGPSLAEAKRAQAVYKAERERLALMREKGELVPAEDVKTRWYEHGRAIRDNLISIPDRIASQLAASTDTREVHQLLSQEITGALRVLADG